MASSTVIAGVLIVNKHVTRIITGLLALLASSLALALAWTGAQQRATTDDGKLLQSLAAVFIVLMVHLLPTLLRRRHALVRWPVWLLCLSLACSWHSSWFYSSFESASEVRQAGSAAARAVAAERSAIEQALAGIKARPVATVAAQLSRTTDSDRREALAFELAEARRAAGLRDRLVAVSGTVAGTVQVHPSTPGYGQRTAGAAAGTRSGTDNQIDIQLIMSVVAAVLIELLGALLWSAAMRGDDDSADVTPAVHTPAPTVVQQVVNFLAPVMSGPAQAAGMSAGVVVVDEVADLRAAIMRGECRGTVRGIKQYLGCGQEAATRLKRSLDMTS